MVAQPALEAPSIARQMPPHTRLLLGVCLGALSLLNAAFIRGHAAPAAAYYFSGDQQAYIAIARAPFSAEPQVHHRPYAWRILPSLLAWAIGGVAGGPERGFLILTFGTFALLPLAALSWMAALRISTTTATACAAVMAFAPPVVGLFAWDVVRVDAFAILLMFVLATATVRGNIVVMSATVVALAFTKEVVFIGVFFAVAWALFLDRRLLLPALAGGIVALLVRSALLPWLVPADPRFQFDNLSVVRAVLSSLSVGYLARRLLLATVGTWNVLIPVVATALGSARLDRRERALALALAATMAQLVFAGDNERLVAVGYPFLLGLCAIQLDTLSARRRLWAGVVITVSQVPWLLQYGRVWPVPSSSGELPHFPPIRYVEIVILCLSVAAAAVAALRHSRTARTVTS